MPIFKSEEVRCWNCGTYLMGPTAELPFEVPSTGAIFVKISADLQCPRCHKQGNYSMMPKLASVYMPKFSVDK